MPCKDDRWSYSLILTAAVPVACHSILHERNQTSRYGYAFFFFGHEDISIDILGHPVYTLITVTPKYTQ